jgi:hypothetical protein
MDKTRLNFVSDWTEKGVTAQPPFALERINQELNFLICRLDFTFFQVVQDILNFVGNSIIHFVIADASPVTD